MNTLHAPVPRTWFKFTVISAAAIVTLLNSASAAVLSTSAEYYESGSLVDSQSAGGLPTSISSAGGSNGRANAYSSVDGILLASARTFDDSGGGGVNAAFSSFAIPFPSPSGGITSTSVAIWEDTVTNLTGVSIDYIYKFHVSNPRVGIEDLTDFAALSLDITLDGASVWSAFMQRDGTGVSYASTNNTIVAPTESGLDAYFVSFDASAPLGIFAPGDTFTVRYELKSYASTSIVGSDTFAVVGDPAFFEGTPVTGIPSLQITANPVTNQVPDAGSTAALLGLTLSGLFTLRHKIRS